MCESPACEYGGELGTEGLSFPLWVLLVCTMLEALTGTGDARWTELDD